MKLTKFAEQWIAGHKLFQDDEFNGQMGDSLLDLAIVFDEQNHTRESADTLFELFKQMYTDSINPIYPKQEDEIASLHKYQENHTL